MKKHLRRAFAFMLVAPMGALADSIDPDVIDTTVPLGGSITVTKKVTIDEAPAEALLDVMFLFDTTGSMAGALASATDAASDILTELGSFVGAGGSLHAGVARYDDFDLDPFGSSGDVPYELVQDLTDSAADVGTAIASLVASGGNDGPESNLHALTELATGADTGPRPDWRADATKVAVWLGDAPGHLPGDGGGTYPGDDTVASTIGALNAEGITVHGIDFGAVTGAGGIGCGTGQADDITTGTGGTCTTSAGLDSEDLADDIVDAVTATFAEYEIVSLTPLGDTGGVLVEITCPDSVMPGSVSPDLCADGAYTGEFSREVPETFEFEVMFTGLEKGLFEFEIVGRVDGGIVVREFDRIKVPEPASLGLLGLGLLGMGWGARRRAA